MVKFAHIHIHTFKKKSDLLQTVPSDHLSFLPSVSSAHKANSHEGFHISYGLQTKMKDSDDLRDIGVNSLCQTYIKSGSLASNINSSYCLMEYVHICHNVAEVCR